MPRTVPAVLRNILCITTLREEGCSKSSSLLCVTPSTTTTYPARPKPFTTTELSPWPPLHFLRAGVAGWGTRRGPIGQGLISWWGPCPLEVPGRPKCGQGPRHKSRPCPSEPHGGAVLGTDGGRRGRNEHPGGAGIGNEMGCEMGCETGCGAMKLVGQLSGCVSGEC